MAKRYTLIEVEGGVEVFTEGPFETENVRDQVARRIRAAQEEDDGLFWAEVDERGSLTVRHYKARIFLEDPTGSVG